nr:mycofactocin precursor MftA [Kineococcus aurantiacus]
MQPLAFCSHCHYSRATSENDLDWRLIVIDPAPSPTPVDASDPSFSSQEVLLSEVLVEEVSIDGMCGVY